MKVDTGKLQVLTLAAILVLVSGGIAAYAQGQSASATSAGSPTGSALLSPAATNSTTSTPLRMDAAGTVTTFTTTITKTVTLTTTTSTSTATSTASHPLCSPATPPGQVGRLVLPITPTGSQTGGISFSDSKGCVASITTVGGVFNVEVTLKNANPVTQYNVVLVANGTSYVLGNMVTGQSGAGHMLNQVLLKTGTYTVSLQIFDTSSTPGQSALVLQTGQGTIVSQPFPAKDSGNGQSDHGDKGDKGNQGDQGKSGQDK